MKGFSDALGFAKRPPPSVLLPEQGAETVRPEPREARPEGRPEPRPEIVALGDRLLAGDADGLDDRALLMLVLGLVMPGRDVDELAVRALAMFGSFGSLLASDERELRAVQGFGTHTVAALRLLHNAAVRLARAGLLARRLLDDRAALDAYLGMMLSRERIEQFRILFLDASDGLVADEAQARGTVNHTPVYPREVVRRAIELDAVSIVLVHNHPSGDPEPSRDDVEMTREIEGAARLFGIVVRDHLIVGNGRSLSFRTAGLLGQGGRG